MRETEAVWLFVVFDLPNVTHVEKMAHVRFRNMLLRRGFTRLQWSVYARAYPRDRSADSDRDGIGSAVPRGGRVRLLAVTDMQFARMLCFDGHKRLPPEQRMDQIVMIG